MAQLKKNIRLQWRMQYDKIETPDESDPAIYRKASEIARMLGLSESRTRAILKELVIDGILDADGETKGKSYHLPKKARR